MGFKSGEYGGRNNTEGGAKNANNLQKNNTLDTVVSVC